MCVPIHERSQRERILMSIAGLALAAGVGLPYFVHPAGGWNKDWFDALRGLLLGMSIGMNLLLAARRRNHTA